jgi:hypothetical protein
LGAIIGDGWIVDCSSALADHPPDARSDANHIADVCSAGITINLHRGTALLARVAPPRVTFPAAFHWRELYARSHARVEADPLARAGALKMLRKLFRSSPRNGASVWWHRAGGPAPFAAALNTPCMRNTAGCRMAESEDRRTRRQCTAARASVGAALARHRDALLTLRGSTVEQFRSGVRMR